MIATIIILVLMAMKLGVSLAKNDDEKKEKYNFLATLIAEGIEIALFWWAGLFDNFK